MNKSQLQLIELLVSHEWAFELRNEEDYYIYIPCRNYCYTANMYDDFELDAVFNEITKEMAE